MSGFRTHRGVCAPIREDNVDTDQIIPSREMKTIGKAGLGEGLFAGWRYRYERGARVGLNEAFILNQPAYRNASVLLGGENFGCGSSREHAVWALYEYGIRTILAESFGRIFSNNCARNRLLAICLPSADLDTIERSTASDPQRSLVEIDLAEQLIRLPNAERIRFEVAASDRAMLLSGLDYIDYTLEFAHDIEAHVAHDRTIRSWAHL